MQNKSLEKIVVSTTVGRLRNRHSFEDKILPAIANDLAIITGQKPSIRSAKKSIAGFKIREGDIVGLKVTLRGKRMENFLKKFVEVSLPRVRDFRGIDTKAIDTQGNLTIGVGEHIVFPEVNPDETKIDFGLEVTLVSNTKDRGESYKLFKSLGVPLMKEEVDEKK